ncbi:hypothetical protein BGZ94_002141, partial [Podila epigama]
MCHGYGAQRAIGVSLDSVMSQILQFILANPYEVLTVEFNQFDGPSAKVAAIVMAKIKQYFTLPDGHELMYSRDGLSEPWPTLRKMILDNQRIMIFLSDLYYNVPDPKPGWALMKDWWKQDGFQYTNQDTFPAELNQSYHDWCDQGPPTDGSFVRWQQMDINMGLVTDDIVASIKQGKVPQICIDPLAVQTNGAFLDAIADYCYSRWPYWYRIRVNNYWHGNVFKVANLFNDRNVARPQDQDKHNLSPPPVPEKDTSVIASHPSANMYHGHHATHAPSHDYHAYRMQEVSSGYRANSYGQSYDHNYANNNSNTLAPASHTHTHLDSPSGSLDQRTFGPPTRIKPPKQSSGCLPCFPCIRSTCCRAVCCICIVLVLTVIVLAIVIATVFELPTVDYMGPEGNPKFTLNQGNVTLGLDLLANIRVQNPNPIGFNFDSIAVTAYFPGYSPPIGDGKIEHVSFPSHSTRTIQFPISAQYSRQEDPGFTVIQGILSTCGILGDTSKRLIIDYDLKVTLNILGVKISPSVKNQHADFNCPAN